MLTFKELGVEEKVIQAVEELGFETAMPIQEKVIPALLNENAGDVIALAQTGTGKTAAFGLPLVQLTDASSKNIQHLVLAPTRELCLQIADDLVEYAKYKPAIKIAAVFGGSSMEKQIRMIKSGAHIISATPGRLVDLINRGVIKLSKVKSVVLDEADEMLNMGFREELELILAQTPKEKNTFLFSATMPSEVRKIANRYMNNPVEISVGKRNAGAEDITHVAYMVHAKDKYLTLKRIADFYPEIYGIIFCRTRKETQEVADLLLKDGYNAEALHGDLSQPQRDVVMNKFRNKHLSLLIATDVAARGIDVDSLSHIINFNLPDETEIYTHRSGRTGRAGRKGTSIVISNMKERHKLQQIEKQIGKKFNYLPVPGGKEICEKQLFHLIDRMEKVEVDNLQITEFLPAIYKKLEWLDREELIKKFVSLEFNRFLDYYKNSQDISSSGNERDNNRSYQFTRFFINLGRTDNLKPATIIGMVNDYTNIRNIEIGDIEILKNFSFFEADKNFTENIIGSFSGKNYNGRQIAVEIAGEKKGDKRSSGNDKRSYGNDKRSFGRKNDSKPNENRFRKSKKRKAFRD